MTRVAVARRAKACTWHGAPELFDDLLLPPAAFLLMPVNGQRQLGLIGVLCLPTDVDPASIMESSMFNLPLLDNHGIIWNAAKCCCRVSTCCSHDMLGRLVVLKFF